jgi:RND family efflux transporter MFP subunit
VALVVGLGVVAVSAAVGQAPPTATKVDTEPLDLTAPDRYQVPSHLEPVRHVRLMATADGIVRSQDAKAGATVREGQEVAQLDRGEAAARVKIAHAEVKEQQAAVETAKLAAKAGSNNPPAQHALEASQARLEAAQARAELAQIALDHCSLRAPFPGKVIASPVFDGQFVAKGTVIAELADVSGLRVLIPVPRVGTAVGSSLSLDIEGQSVTGKVQALLPLPDSLAVLRELTLPLAAAWVAVPNPNGSLEPGQRVVSPALPTAPIATIPSQALHKGDPKDKAAAATVQVIRNEYVTDVKVRVLGNPVPDRVQVSGPLRPTDALIVLSTHPLLAGTLIRFNTGAGHGIEATSPNPAESGVPAELTPPRTGSRTAPIGAPGSAVPRGKSAAQPSGVPADKPAAKPAGAVPF